MIDVTLNGTFKEAVLEQIGGLETHGEPLEIMEDDEKVVVWMRPCGSGQFLQETRHVCEAPQKCVLCKACPQTWNIDNFPVYCVHAPRQEILSIKQIGWLVMVNCPLPEERDVPATCLQSRAAASRSTRTPTTFRSSCIRPWASRSPPMWRNPPSGNNCIEEPPSPLVKMKPCQFDRASLIGV